MLKRWQPNASQPWDIRRVLHLHRRAGFAPTWSQIQSDLRDGPEQSIERLLAPAKSAAPEFEQMSSAIGDAAIASEDIRRLKAWWLFRMLSTPDSLGEILTLMWHNHFATSHIKVQNIELMRRQNERIRAGCRGEFGPLLSSIAKEPATLIWLDADANRKEHPNENLAREIMELFSLGVGNYTESDVKHAARALTGWTVEREQFRQYDDRHDAEQKTIFGQQGNWTGDDLLRLLIDHPAAAERLAYRLCHQFMGPSTNTPPLVEELAAGLRAHDMSIAWGMETLLHSNAFFADDNINNRVRSPIEFVVGAARSLEISPHPNTYLLGEWAARIGQDLFQPPNVFGWPGGRAWLSSRALIARANYAGALVAGHLARNKEPLDLTGLAERYGKKTLSSQKELFAQLLVGTSADQIEHANGSVNEFVVSLLSSPNAQLD